MTAEFLPDVADTWGTQIRRAAQWVSSDFPGVSRERIEQSLWELVRENQDLLDPDTSERLLIRVAERTALQLRGEHLYGTCQYNYRPSDVRVLLESWYFPEEWLTVQIPEDARSWEGGNDRLDMMADISVGVAALHPADQSRLMAHYGLQHPVEPESAESALLRRALYHLVEVLNNYRGRPPVEEEKN